MEELTLRKHQTDAVDFYKKQVLKGVSFFPIFFEMGCIDGEAVVSYCTIKDRRFRTTQLAGLINKKEALFIRGLLEKDNVFGRVTVTAVIDSGYKECLEITTERTAVTNEKVLRATPEHQLLTPSGWRQVQDLAVGDEVYVNGMYLTFCPYCGKEKYTVRPASMHTPCKSCALMLSNYKRKGDTAYVDDRGYVQITGTRTIEYRHLVRRGAVPMHRMVMEQVSGRRLKPYEVVHHIDGNKLNNDPGNLEAMEPYEHSSEHAKAVQVPIAVKVANIKCAGERHVYDVVCAGDNHNFIANGFVAHNCGKSATALSMADWLY